MQEPTAPELRPLGPSESAVDLVEFCCPPGEAWTVIRAGLDARLVHTRSETHVAGRRWTLSRYAIIEGRIANALDRTRFEADAESFSEVSLEQTGIGSNRHAEPIRLPRVLHLGTWHQPFSGSTARVALAHAGAIEIVVGGQRARLRSACLLAEEAGVERVQWLAEGIGELAFGPRTGTLERWMTAHRGPDGKVVLADVGRDLREQRLPELSVGWAMPPRRSLY